MRPHYLRTYRRHPSHADSTLPTTWRGRALAVLACAVLLSCLGGCGGGEDLEEPAPADAETETGPTPPPANLCQLNPKVCI